MKIQTKHLGNVLLGASLLLGGTAFAAGDSDADADGGWHTRVAASSGVMIAVPINSNGQEDTNAAQMRLITTTEQVTSSTDLTAVWNSGVDVSNQPVITPTTTGDSSTSARDSSTWGRYGWNSWRGYGWQPSYYYNSYQPYYSYYGNYYNYSSPYYYNYYYPSSYSGYYGGGYYGGYGYPYYGSRYYYYPYYGYGYGYGNGYGYGW